LRYFCDFISEKISTVMEKNTVIIRLVMVSGSILTPLVFHPAMVVLLVTESYLEEKSRTNDESEIHTRH